MRRVLIVHGPNLNLLGEREPEVYGTLTLAQLEARLRRFARERGVRLRTFQSNHEGELIDFLQAQRRWAQGIVINPGALTHTSYALRDCLSAIGLPAVEVHLSNLLRREPFRRRSVIRPVCLAQVHGLGWRSYLVGLERLLDHLETPAGRG